MSRHLHWTSVPVEPETLGEGVYAHYVLAAAFGLDEPGQTTSSQYAQLDGVVLERGSAQYVWLLGYVDALRGSTAPHQQELRAELSELLDAVKAREQVILRIRE